jgi:hypothetical protein
MSNTKGFFSFSIAQQGRLVNALLWDRSAFCAIFGFFWADGAGKRGFFRIKRNFLAFCGE